MADGAKRRPLTTWFAALSRMKNALTPVPDRTGRKSRLAHACSALLYSLALVVYKVYGATKVCNAVNDVSPNNANN
jgi:hypothetical protein